jgi:flagellin
VDGYLQKVDTVATNIGSAMNRFVLAAQVLRTSSVNFQAAKSRIKDADVAEESAALVRGNILQQAAALIVAQANRQPGVALTLLASAGQR